MVANRPIDLPRRIAQHHPANDGPAHLAAGNPRDVARIHRDLHPHDSVAARLSLRQASDPRCWCSPSTPLLLRSSSVFRPGVAQRPIVLPVYPLLDCQLSVSVAKINPDPAMTPGKTCTTCIGT